MKRRELILLVGATAACIGLFFALFERVELTVENPPRGEAARNRTLALEQLVKRLGMATSESRTLEPLPADDAAILLLAERSSVTPSQVDELFSWVERGGVLVVPAEIPWEGYYDDESAGETNGGDAQQAAATPPTHGGGTEPLPEFDAETEEEVDPDGDEEARRDADARREQLLDRRRRPTDGPGAPRPISPEWAVAMPDDPLLAPFGLAMSHRIWWDLATVEAESSAGGHEGQDERLAQFAVKTYRTPRLELLPAQPEATATTPTPTSLTERLARARQTYETAAGSTSSAPLPVHGHVSDQLGALAIWAHVGDGTLIVLHDPDFLFNGFIGLDQNARLTWHLIHHAPASATGREAAGPSTLRVVNDVVFPTLAEVILERGTLAVLAAVLVLLVWLWRTSRRTAPLRRSRTNPAERNLAEHLRASGRFFQRSKLLEVPLAALQRRAERAAYRAQPGLEHLPGPARLDGLAHRANTPRSSVAKALAAEIVESPTEFTRRVATLHALYHGADRSSASASASREPETST